MNTNPVIKLRSALAAILDGAAFQYNEGATRNLIRKGQKALALTAPIVAHSPPVGIFRYDPSTSSFVPVSEQQAMDKKGNLLPGHEYLFRHPAELVAH